MYAQSYQDEKLLGIPDTYSGTALRDTQGLLNEEAERSTEVSASKNPWENESKDESAEKSGKGWLSDVFDSITSQLGLKARTRNFNLKFGTEELLIIGVAAFLLFSKERDIECALMLAALLLIT